MIEIIQSHAKGIATAFTLILFALLATACNVSELPTRIQARVEVLEQSGSIVFKTPFRGNYLVQWENARQEDGYFLADRLDISGRGFEFHAVNYRRPIVRPHAE